jgi:histidinol-phosphate aminotransferase
MSTHLSRRELLKKGALASALLTIPGVGISEFVNQPSLIIPRRNSDDAVKLNSNENPYGPSKSAREAIINSISEGNRYPRNQIKKLKKIIADNEGLTPDHIMITAGSTELLGLAGLVYGLKGGNLISSQPTFDFLLEYSSRIGANWIKVPLTEDHQYNLQGIHKATDSNTKLIFVCNPNNPTGIEIPHEDVKAFCKEMAPKYPVYLDEAYIELSSMGLKGSMAAMVDDYPNLIVARTFSKIYGMAGLRIGYALAHPKTIQNLSYHHTGRNITPSVTSVAAAIASIQDDEFFEMSRSLNAKARNLVSSRFEEWGVSYLPSNTSFIFFKTEKFDVDIRKELEKRNVFIRNYGHVPGWARVSMGTMEEMEIFLAETKGFIA